MTESRSTDTIHFSSLSGRSPGRFVRLARRWSPGVAHVLDKATPYTDAWRRHNDAALSSAEQPLWVVLGDSLSLGIGATSIEQSWVLQAARLLAADGLRYRIVNLAISGARVSDVVTRALPAMRLLRQQPSVVTVLIGSNDVVSRRLRAALPSEYATLLAQLPHGSFVAVTDRPFGVLGDVAEMVLAAAATGAVHAVRARLSTRYRAEDHFHLNDHGYSLIAADFVLAMHEVALAGGPQADRFHAGEKGGSDNA